MKDQNTINNLHQSLLINIVREELSHTYIRNKRKIKNNFSNKKINNIDNNLLLDLIKKNKLIPFLKNNCFIRDKLPDLYKKIKYDAKIEFLKSLKLSYLTSEISLFLEANNIKNVILKGIPLSQYIYNDFSIRGSGDLDILIDEDTLLKTIKLLNSKGFIFANNDFPLNKNSIFFTYSKWVYYELTLKREEGSNCDYIDLHWRINNNISGTPTFSEIYKFKEKIIINNKEISIPNLKHNILLISANAAKDKWYYYRNLIDLELLFSKGLNRFNSESCKNKFFIMSLYKSTQLSKSNLYRLRKRDIIKIKVADYISEYNHELKNIKFLKKNKLKYRIILFLYNIYLCESINDLISNICITIITPKSIINKDSGEINSFLIILKNRIISLFKLFLR